MNSDPEQEVAVLFSRMIANEGILARINELKTTMAAGVVDSEIRKRNHRVQVLQGSLNRMLALIGSQVGDVWQPTG
jgi:hypothetical protein